MGSRRPRYPAIFGACPGGSCRQTGIEERDLTAFANGEYTAGVETDRLRGTESIMGFEDLLPYDRKRQAASEAWLPPSFQSQLKLTPEQLAIKATEDRDNWYCPRCNRVKPRDIFKPPSGFNDYGRTKYCEECVEFGHRWRLAVGVRNRRLRRLGIVPDKKRIPRPSPKARFNILERDGFACRYCGRRAPEYEILVDHIVPVAMGGTSEPDNLVAACSECNDGKGTRLLREPIQPIPLASHSTAKSC